MESRAAMTHEGDLSIARCLEAEVTSQAESRDVAVENLKEVLGLYFEDQWEPVDCVHPMVTTFQLSA